MTKKELIAAVQSEHAPDLTKKKVGEIIDTLFDSIAEAIKASEGRYAHPGFGTFTVKHRAARTGRNPQTGEPIQIKASKTVGFKAAPELKKAVN